MENNLEKFARFSIKLVKRLGNVAAVSAAASVGFGAGLYGVTLVSGDVLQFRDAWVKESSRAEFQESIYACNDQTEQLQTKIQTLELQALLDKECPGNADLAVHFPDRRYAFTVDGEQLFGTIYLESGQVATHSVADVQCGSASLQVAGETTNGGQVIAR